MKQVPQPQKPPPEHTVLTIRMPRAMREEIERRAADKALNASTYARMLIQEGMKREKRKR